MPGITFYRQLRFDGGVRTGIDVDGETVYSLFEEGTSDDDPRLRWFVDVRCEGPGLPRAPAKARKWLLDHAQPLREALDKFGNETAVGIDRGVSEWEVTPDLEAGVTTKIVFMATRKVDGREMAKVLKEVGSRLEESIKSLGRFRAAR
jgi:hypothetical protein